MANAPLANLTLNWKGWHGPSELLDAEGRNLFRLFPVTGLSFKESDLHACPGALVLEISLAKGFTAKSIRGRVELADIERLAAAHGHTLSPAVDTPRMLLDQAEAAKREYQHLVWDLANSFGVDVVDGKAVDEAAQIAALRSLAASTRKTTE